ncbi:hypothetical protein [Paenibacillus tyrfis]|uniref:hypothetical protein n=1 Tax=Paenibacillus tyrfis TaxID=1501230 RepID=UPI00209F64FD|nr:hypothetical protein [Paenibacillus tyrfis]MCP1311884.1 hypothetical protein [Paenibacillus tyrfis]
MIAFYLYFVFVRLNRGNVFVKEKRAFSTFVAFRAQPEMAISRMVLAFAASAFIGLWASRGVHASALRNTVSNANEQAAAGKKTSSPRIPTKRQTQHGKLNCMKRWSMLPLKCLM